MLVLTDENNQVITRGNPFGIHGSEEKYRQHLHDNNYEEYEIQMHIKAIVEREERIAKAHGMEHKWWFPSNSKTRRLLRQA